MRFESGPYAEQPVEQSGSVEKKTVRFWIESSGPEALMTLRQEGFFNQFGIDEDAVCEVIAKFCSGEIDIAELNEFFDNNNDQSQVGDIYNEGTSQEYTITAVGHEAKEQIFKRLAEETGVEWFG